MQRRARSNATALLLVLCACTRTSVPATELVADAAARPAPHATPLRLSVGAHEICAFDELRAFCIGAPRRAGEPFSVRSGPPGTAEVVGACHRSTRGVVRCQGVELAQDASSIAAAPYALRKDGSVLALDLDDDETHVNTYEQRRLVAAALGTVKKLSYAHHAGCALRQDESVVCWTEPWTLGFTSKITAPKLRVVAGASGVADLVLHSWLQLCVLDRTGVVRCSPPPPQPLDGCVAHGDGARCGARKAGPTAGLVLQGPTFDPALMLYRPLLPVTDAALSMAAFRWPAAEIVESPGERVIAALDPGGCAVRADGVVCWNMSGCAARPWLTTTVQGLPAGARITLGAQRGYALTEDGVVYTFLRRAAQQADRAARCDDGPVRAAPAVSASRLELPPAFDLAAGVLLEPSGYAALDCVSLRDGSLRCWRVDAAGALGPALPVPLP